MKDEQRSPDGTWMAAPPARRGPSVPAGSRSGWQRSCSPPSFGTLAIPLSLICQAQWHFSSAIVTMTFAVHAAGALATLLLAGRSSDQAGRKPVLPVALGPVRCSATVAV